MYFQKSLSVLLVLCFLAQNIFFFSLMSVFAAPDPDGSANIDLYLTPVVPASSLIGTNFTLDISLENKNTSDGDGFRPGLILSLPTGVSFISAGILGSPVRSVTHASGSTLLFFETTQIALK